MKCIARRSAAAVLAATVASSTLFAPLPARAGSAVADGTDFVVSADANEEYLVEAAIDGYGRVVKKGAGKVVLRTTTTEYAGNVVIEEGALYVETTKSNALRLNGTLTGGSTGTSDILFRKRGPGLLFLNGDVDLARSAQVDQGLMEMSSPASRVFRDGFILKGGSRSLIGDGHTLLNWVRVGLDSHGVFHQTGGILGVGREVQIGTGTTIPSIGHWAMSGGEAHVSNTVHVAYYADSFGSFIQTGGLFKLDNGSLSAGRAGTAVFHLAGGTNDTCVTQGGQTQRFYLGDYGGCSDVTVSGDGTLLTTETLRFGGGGGTISTNVFNVKDGATVKAARFFKHRAAGAASLITVNADGGTLMPTMSSDWTGVGPTHADFYKGNPSHFVVWKKGLVIDTSEFSGNNPVSHMPFSFESPCGKGVASVTLPTEVDYTTADYVGPARIVFEDATGWGASAYAEYDYETKKHSRVVVTSRGCNYGDGAKAYVESPDRATRFECALALSDNAGLGGELVKRGSNPLHLYATNTLTGGIAVESGTLFAETDGVVRPGTPVRVEYGATLRLPDANPILLSSFAGAGAVTDPAGATNIAVTVTNSLRASCGELFAGRYADFPAGLAFAPGATFTITDPENLATYSHSPAVTAFTASRVDGAPRLAFEGDVPPGSGSWSLTAKSDAKYMFGPVVGTLIMVK
ncbi:MAG: hypothetical protein II839_00510 [Kiritimatiellae bacterium]|nr:hypothetical protein [Kiritimatiellia bacterium]